MKTILFAVLLITASLGLQLQIATQLNLDQAYSLACSGAQGQVTYQADNLPQGVRLSNDKIELFGDNYASGYYPVKIRAQDSTGAVDERIVVLVLSGRAGSVSVNTGNLFANQNTVRTVRISSTTTSNIRSNANADLNTALFGSSSATATAPTPVAPLPQPDTGVNALLDSLQVPTSFGPGSAPGSAAASGNTATPSSSPSSTTSNNGNYPTINFPTGGNANSAPNLAPTFIADEQSQRTDANRKPITVDDVKTKAIFERQLNAAKALANLLNIVKQATANKNAAQEQTVKRQDLYNQAVNRQRDAQSAVTKAEGDVARIRQAITQLTENINQIQKRLSNLDALAKDKNAQRDAARQGVSTAQNQLNEVTSQILGNRNDLGSAQDAQTAKQAQCTNLDKELNNAKNDRDAKASQASDVAFKQAAAKIQNNADNQRVQQLQNQLAAAQAKAAASLKDLNDLAAQQNNLKNAINDANNRINDLQDRKAKCAADLDSIANRITSLKARANQLNQRKANIESQIKSLSDKIAGLTTQINSYPPQVADLNNQLAQSNKNLNYLRNQLPIFSRILNDAYNTGNSANDQVRAAKENLDAASKRFLDEQKIEQTATYNIQLARTEKDQADQAVQALLRDGAGILPYAAAPSDNGYTVDATTGGFKINSWTDFVLSSYGVGVKPLFVGDLKTLYSFKLPVSGSNTDANANANGSTGANTNAGAGNNECNASASRNYRALSGFIIGVNNNSYRILSDGKAIEVTFADCAVGLANRPNYVPSVGDVVAIKGFARNTNSFRATQVACVSQ